MAKNVIINGVTYPAVPYVNIPKSDGSGSAKFVDTDGGDAGAGDILAGKKAFVGGEEVTGNIESKSSADLTSSGATVTVPAGHYPVGASKDVATQEKTATPSVTAQDITPDAGKLLSKVVVNAVVLSGNAAASDVLNGKTFYNTSLEKVIGSATVPAVSQDATTKVLSVT